MPSEQEVDQIYEENNELIHENDCLKERIKELEGKLEKISTIIEKYKQQFELYNRLSEDETNNIATHYFMIITDLNKILEEGD